MVRMATKNCSPGDDKMRLVFRVAYDETSCIASNRDASEEASKDRFCEGTAGSGQSMEIQGQTWTGAMGSSQDRYSGRCGGWLKFWRRLELLVGLSPIIGGRSKKKATWLLGKKKAKRKARRSKKCPNGGAKEVVRSYQAKAMIFRAAESLKVRS